MKIRSLRLKLVIFYIVSVLILVAISFAFMGFYSLERAKYSATQLMEVGIGYLNENTPITVTEKLLIRHSRDISIDSVLSDFSQLTNSSSFSGPNETMLLPWLQITNEETHQSFRIYAGDFPITVTHPPSVHRTVFTKTLENRDDILLVASLETQSWLNINAAKSLYLGSIYLLPFVLFFSGVFGWIVSRQTVSPIKRVAEAAARISATDLSQRVNVKSEDEIGQLARSFNLMADRLELAFTQQKRFVSDAAHELRTPLASLKASVTKALSADRSNEEYRQLLSFILLRTDTLEELVNDLLFLARADEGRLKIGEEIFDLSPVLLETADSFKYLFDERGISFSSPVESGLWVKGDPKLYMRVISNLLDNASKYTPASGSVILKAGHKDANVEIIVEDTGIGMSEEHQAHAFDRFYNAPDKPTAEFSFGLGLSITKSIVTAYKGEVSVTSSLGKGSVFSVTFPKTAPEQG